MHAPCKFFAPIISCFNSIIILRVDIKKFFYENRLQVLKVFEVIALAVVEITKENFEAEFKNSPVPAVLDFWGPKCGPCMALMPKYHELAENPKYEGKFKFCSVDTSKNRRVAMMVRPAVMAQPTFLFFKEGQEVARLGGDSLTIEAITAKVDELIA
ncbi:MAG: hypothetical protein IJP85_06290 [Synergistaceae bacterium]|nr:hypothetical protein [Synergistaceae bacterium]